MSDEAKNAKMLQKKTYFFIIILVAMEEKGLNNRGFSFSIPL